MVPCLHSRVAVLQSNAHPSAALPTRLKALPNNGNINIAAPMIEQMEQGTDELDHLISAAGITSLSVSGLASLSDSAKVSQ